jgi:uncharacterized protein
MSASDAPWRPNANGIALRVRLTPKSSRDAIEGLAVTADGPALKARVRAIPEDGAANAALERLVADWLGVTRNTVAVSGGGKSRVKTLAVSGDARALVAMLQGKLAACTADNTGEM